MMTPKHRAYTGELDVLPALPQAKVGRGDHRVRGHLHRSHRIRRP
jgi:hypothetical protein